MKFTDGFWQMRPGVKACYPAQVHDFEATPEALTVYAPVKHISGRGDTLDGPLFTLRYSTPLENVIRVEVVHFKGAAEREPHYKINQLPKSQPVIQVDDDSASLTSGALSVIVRRGADWLVEFKAGDRRLTASGWRGLGLVDSPEGRFMLEQLDLGVGEWVYGLGERFTAFVRNGQVVDLWNADGGTSSEQAYKNVPFYVTNRGYGVFVAHPEKVSFEVASEKVERVQFSLPGERLEYYLIYGPTPKEILERYTALTGRPALPPAWSFGLWLSTSFTTDYDEKAVTGFIQGMADRHIPLHVFHFDCFWMKEFHWCDFQWDPRCFPDPQGMLARLKERGLHICVWINPYIAQRSTLFDEAAANGFLLRRPNGDVWQTDQWQPGMGIVDFTNPTACQWFQDKLRPLLAMGVDTFKTDFGERIPTDVLYFNRADPNRMHNFYTYLYNQTVFDLLKEVRGEGEALVFARSATAGGQQFPVHWGGDSTATFESMAETLRGGLSLGLSGFGFWSHDIGGFEQTATVEVYKRWCAFGLLSSHSRLHGSSSYRVPWAYDEEAVAVLRKFTTLKCSLMPYLFGAACQAHTRGLPMLRAMLLEFPDDPACEILDRQYMLGESLLVAPVFSRDGEVDYYVPAGRWTNLLDGRVIEGPRWLREMYDCMSLPLLVRPGTLLPVGGRSDRPDYDYSDGLTLQLYELADGRKATAAIPNLKGETQVTFTATCTGREIRVEKHGQAGAWKLLLVGISSVAKVEGGEAEETESGMIIKSDVNRELLRILYT